MKENFKSCLDFVMKHECVFASGHYGDYTHVITENVSGDRGGPTKFGIDQRSHPHVDIRHLDYLGAARIYRDGEWTKCRCDDLPVGYDLAVFDTAVNCGCGTAVLMLQRALNQAITRDAQHFFGVAPLKEDSFIGPKTIGATHKAGAVGLENFLSLREDHYRDLINKNARLKKFASGWAHRVEDLARKINDARGVTEEEAIA